MMICVFGGIGTGLKLDEIIALLAIVCFLPNLFWFLVRIRQLETLEVGEDRKHIQFNCTNLNWSVSEHAFFITSVYGLT